ncbi:NAD(+)/NADH kinase [Candidatus Woesearchaeota archaeon]|nr:NAD(+)/NADH kinase [Candidatus Woesearchaeota archaeon]
MYFITSKTDKESLGLAKLAAAYLKENNIEHHLSKEISAIGHKRDLTWDYEIVVAVGDNKFILETFRKLGKSQIPVFAIASTQSFLAQANSLNFRHYLNLIKKGKYEIFKRARLVAKFDKITTPVGLNDIGLFCSKSASLLKYSLVLNDEMFWKDSSDGIIVSTPTGSTGYSLSAGGPIVLDEPHIFTIASISSLEKHSPLVVSDNTKIKITDIEGSNPMAIVDGEVRVPMHANEVSIEKSPYDANFVIFSKEYSIESKLKKRTLKTNVDKLKNMPASAKLLYKILVHEGNMTQKEIINASLLPERTVRYALDILLRNALITSQPHFIDARQMVYGV